MANTSKGWGFLKRTPSTDAKKQPSKYAKYEQNRSQRKVQEGWKTGRPWLSIEKINNLMSCTWCEQQWTTAKLETLKSHETSNIHIKNRDIIAGKSKAADGMETEAMKCVESLNKAVMDKLSLLFRNAHALSLAGRPFSDFEWMSKLDQMKGLDVGKTYLNRKRAKEFTDCIAKVQMNTIKDNIHKAKFVSILSDGSTDASITEIEMIYTRVCVNGIVQVFFVNTAYVAKSDASGIIEAMKRSVEKLDVPWDDFTKKLVGMGSDGASVMLGCNNGVAAHLRRIQPVMVAVHCYAHKLELAFKDAIKHVPLDSKLTSCLLQGLYYLYHNSALNRSNLKDSFKSLGMKVVLPTRIGGTRWVGHLLRALINFISGYQAIKKHLEQVCASATHKVSNSTSGKAKGLLKLITSRDIILYCHFMADIATILSRVSKVFQVRECCAADIHGIISETSMLINVYATKDGPYLSKAKQILNLNEETSSMRQRPGESFPAARRNLVAGLSVSLKNRFELDDIIQAMAIANFHTWPLPNSEADNTKEIEDFGDDHLPVILSHFETSLKNGAVDEIEAVLEWTALKSTLYASQSNEIQHLTWQRVNRMFPARYSNILAVMDLLLTIPGSSSECERGFRHMKSLKTTFRTCLSEDSLASQMCIKLHSPSIEAFDPVPAIRLWNAGGLRRPLYMDSKERNLIRVAKQSVNSDINERIATETESHHVDEEEDYLSVGAAADKEDLVQDDENGADSDHDDQFSDNEDYGNEGRVYRVMCREGLIEE